MEVRIAKSQLTAKKFKMKNMRELEKGLSLRVNLQLDIIKKH
jgi:hypothetical protein